MGSELRGVVEAEKGGERERVEKQKSLHDHVGGGSLRGAREVRERRG